MDLLLPACRVGTIGIIVFLIGIVLGGLFGTIQKISNILYRPLNLGFIHQAKVYLPRPDQVLYSKQLRLYLRNEISVIFVFFGGLAILVAAVMIIIVVFCGALG